MRKALKILNRILFSYVTLLFGKKIFGKKYYEKRIQKRHQKNATRVKEGISELQGLFTKVGQLMSMMSNILPEAYADVLESLQDHAPAGPFEDTRVIIEEDLDESVENIFKSIDEHPIASASIGQVYKAKLKTGEDVAVKVQHKNINELATADLEIIRKLIKRVSFFVGVSGLEYVYEQVRKMIMDELDFNQERHAMEALSKNLENVEGISVPEVYSEYSSFRIITTAFQNAVKITNVDKLDEWGLDREKLARKLILAYCKMILEDGYYHADPHPGNVFVKPNGEIVLLDFGATAELNEAMRKEIPRLIQAAVRKDHEKVVQSLQKMGFIGNDGGSEKVARKIVETISNFLSNEVSIKNLNINSLSMDDIKGSSIDRLRRDLSIKELTKSVQVPKDWVLLDRTLILVSGICSKIAPDLDQIEVVKPYLQKRFIKDGGIQQIIIDAIKEQFNAILSLPGQLDKFLKKANEGQLELAVNNDTNRLYALGQQFLMVLGIIATVFLYYISTQKEWFVGTAILSVLLLRSLWVNTKSRRRS
ncbi:MAG: AarF/ABC1/UbiB kinase family protein [Crocinitomicaceae bacterium]|nr:AarF/ABC1/UbiB kinase family protein [Crocinitomicaceae bacterium]